MSEATDTPVPERGDDAAQGQGVKMCATDVLAALGVKVVEVDELPDAVCWVRSQRVGLLRTGLSDAGREAAVDWLTQVACRGVPRPRPPRP